MEKTSKCTIFRNKNEFNVKENDNEEPLLVIMGKTEYNLMEGQGRT